MSSSRANDFIVDRGRLRVFVSGRHDAYTVPQTVMRGPRACVKLIRRQRLQGADDVLEAVMMEGGIAVDQDDRRALFFGGTGDVYHPAVRARLLERLRPVWASEGYSIDWAPRFAYDLVALAGLPGTTVESELHLYPGSWEDTVCPVNDEPPAILGRRAGGTWVLRGASSRAERFIHHGPRLLQAFEDLPRLASTGIKKTCVDTTTTLLFDEERRSLVVVAPVLSGLSAPHWVAESARAAFPDFSVEVDVDVSPAMRLLSRGVALPMASAVEPEAQDEPLSDEEIDETIDRMLAYDPYWMPEDES